MEEESIMNHGASSHNSNTWQQHKAHENQLSLRSSGVLGRMAKGYGTPGRRLFDEGYLRPKTKWIQARQGRESLCCLSHPEIAKQGKCWKPRRHWREIPQREPEKGMWTHQRMSSVVCKQGNWEDESWPVTSSGRGRVGMGVPPGLVGSPHLSHSTKMLEM
jgi:hypothetical protein